MCETDRWDWRWHGGTLASGWNHSVQCFDTRCMDESNPLYPWNPPASATVYFLGYGQWGFGGGEGHHMQTYASALELEGVLPQRGSLQPQVQRNVEDWRQTLWGEEDVPGGDRHDRQFHRSHQVTLSWVFWGIVPHRHCSCIFRCLLPFIFHWQLLCLIYRILVRRRRSAIPRFAKLLGPAFFLGWIFFLHCRVVWNNICDLPLFQVENVKSKIEIHQRHCQRTSLVMDWIVVS